MTEEAPTLKLIAGPELEAELRLRRSQWLYKLVAPSEVAASEADGWTQSRVNKSSVRLQKAKPIDQALEDEVWSLLARLGFIHMSQGRRFVIPVTKGTGHIASKQIDVLAATTKQLWWLSAKRQSQRSPGQWQRIWPKPVRFEER